MIKIANLSAQRNPPVPLDPKDIEFGRSCTPNFFISEFAGGK